MTRRDFHLVENDASTPAAIPRRRFLPAEMGVGIVTVEHGTSEMPGLMSLRDHLAAQFPSFEFIWIAERPRP